MEHLSKQELFSDGIFDCLYKLGQSFAQSLIKNGVALWLKWEAATTANKLSYKRDDLGRD